MDSLADLRWGSLRVAAGLKTKSEPEGTLPRMLRAETSSPSSPWKADVWMGRVGSRALGGRGQARRKQRMRAGQLALSAGSPVHSLRPQLPCPPALTTCWGGPDFKAVVLRVDNLETKVRLPKDGGQEGGREDGWWGSGARALLRARANVQGRTCAQLGGACWSLLGSQGGHRWEDTGRVQRFGQRVPSVFYRRQGAWGVS